MIFVIEKIDVILSVWCWWGGRYMYFFREYVIFVRNYDFLENDVLSCVGRC